MGNIRLSRTLPMIFFGDFNEILYALEKDGGACRRECMMEAFRDVVELCELHDLGKVVHLLGISEMIKNKMIRERLDRFSACDEWGDIFPHAWLRNFPYYRLDHALILLCVHRRV